MAKKKKAYCTKPIDYIQLVDDMSDQAFQFCVEQLYAISKYRVLQKEDVRRVDLKERLLGFNSIVPKDEKGKEQGALNYYIFVLKKYFNNFVKCKAGSRAERYYDRALELMDNALSEDGTIEDVEDLVQIFISFFRIVNKVLDESGSLVINDLTYDVFKEDAELLNGIWKSKKLVPSGINEKQGLFEMPGLFEMTRLFETKFGSAKGRKTAIKLAYINNVIFLCRCLQNSGAFITEEE